MFYLLRAFIHTLEDQGWMSRSWHVRGRGSDIHLRIKKTSRRHLSAESPSFVQTRKAVTDVEGAGRKRSGGFGHIPDAAFRSASSAEDRPPVEESLAKVSL